MQIELNGLVTARPIRILGVNDSGLEAANEAITESRTLPWLQPAEGENVWTLWKVVYRDVIIIGPGNVYVSTFNLTEHDLADPTEYAALRDQLLAAAAE